MAVSDLWPRPYRLRSFMGAIMRVSDDLRKSVVFIGYLEDVNNFKVMGTGFFVHYEHNVYLVTNQHIAVAIGDSPFAIRINKFGDGSDNILIDPLHHEVKWCHFETEDVGLSVIPFNFDLQKHGLDAKVIDQGLFAGADNLAENQFGIGDLCYVVGLFRLMAGKTRNLPFVHSGNIGLMPGQEKVPVADWMSQSYPPKTRYVDGYLVEASNLKGLSGSPVFVRPAHDWDGPGTIDGRSVSIKLPIAHVLLLGIWQSSWDAKPDDVMAVDHGQDIRVPVGIGVVVPVSKLVELLNSEELKKQRNAYASRIAHGQAASPDAMS